jgi:autotransporter-associated beta strand protein
MKRSHRQLTVAPATVSRSAAVVLLLAGLLCVREASAAPPWASYTITNFAEEFGGTMLNTGVWGIFDDRTNVTVSGGQLHLHTVALGTNWSAESNWDAGGIRTLKFQQKFGYFETSMQIADADGLNNAFWLNTPGGFNNEHDHLEIDITEAHFHGHHHMNVHDWQPEHVSSSATLNTSLYPGFHTVGLEWATDGTLRWYLDGAVVRTFSASSLNAYNTMLPLEILFSTKAITFAGTLSSNLVGTHMDVDYVRAWQKPGWLGASNGNWGTTNNWGADGVPAAGDAAIFNGASANRTVSLAADKPVKEIHFCRTNCSAYTFAAGNHLLLGELAGGTGWGGVNVNSEVTNRQVINTAIIAQNPLVFACYSTVAGVSLDLNGSLTSAGSNRTIHFAGAGRVNVAGAISSQCGSLIRFNPGELWLLASNAFTGPARVENGTLIVATNGALGATGGSAYTVVSNGASLAFASNVNYTLNEGVHLAGGGESGRQGALDLLDGTSVTFAGPIALDASATIASGNAGGTLALQGIIDTTTNGNTLTLRGSGVTVLNGPITGDGNVTKSGTGTVVFNAANTYSGNTTVSQGTLVGDAAMFPGDISNSGILVFDQPADGTSTNVISGGGAIVKRGAGKLTLASSNTYGGATTVSNGTLGIAASERISGSSDLIINGGTFDLNGFTETVGDVILWNGTITNTGGSSAQYFAGASYTMQSGHVSARLGGFGALVKTGAGTVTLSGSNTFLGGSTVSNGTLTLAGSLNSFVAVAGGTFTGTGTVNSDVTVNSGVLAPGLSPGMLTVKSNFTLNAGGTLQIEINGTAPGSGHDQVKLTSASSVITLAGDLAIIATNGLATNTTFVILTNSGSAAVSGMFTGKPQGFTFFTSGHWWRVSYAGGNGNDVTLTVASPPAKPLITTSLVTNGFPRLIITGGSNLAYQVQASTNLSNWMTLLATNPPALPFIWSDTNAGGFLKRFYRVLLGP